MSQSNVEIVRAGLDASNRGDWDAVLELTTPDFEFDLTRGVGPDSAVYRRDQVKALWLDFAKLWASSRIELHEFAEVGERMKRAVREKGGIAGRRDRSKARNACFRSGSAFSR